MKTKIIKFLEIEQLNELQKPLIDKVNTAYKKDKMLKKDIIAIRDFAAITFVYGCALRIGELCKLKLHNLNLKDGFVRVVDGKGGDRIIPIPKIVVENLKKWLEIRPNWEGNDFVFCRIKGSTRPNKNEKPMEKKYWNSLMEKLSDETNVRLVGGEELEKPHPHTLRHSRAMALRDNEVPLDVIQSILGHKNINTTAKAYLVVRQRELIKAQEKVSSGLCSI